MAEHIEEFTADHLEECAHLLISTFNAEPWNDNWTLDRAKKALMWTQAVPGFVGLVAVDDGVRALTTGYIEPDDDKDVFYLNIFCVRPDVQGRGVGSRLLGHLKEHLDKIGVTSIYLITHKGTPAESFYRKNGYKASDKDIVMTSER
jgi:aminoglycoside 6'-N-acetyltransferase I